MRVRNTPFTNYKRISITLLCLIMTCLLLFPAAAKTKKSRKVVRVGWHEEPYFITDQSGRWSGYTYDYQQKLVAYTGWDYEYVKGSWSELMQMLEDGEIDMLGNVSYSEERSKKMLFPSLPMGTEAYYLFVPPGGSEIIMEDVTSLNGKKVGVAKGSIQCEIFRSWAKSHGASPKIVELTSTEDESLLLLGSKIDAFVTMDIKRTDEKAEPVWKIGSSDFYFAISKKSHNLLVDLNTAMNRIQDESKYFNQQLHEKYMGSSESNLYLTDKEREWLRDHGKLRVGYQDNYLAFCARDEKTGELTGALKDYLDYASTAFENANIQFEAVPYPTAAAAIEAVKNGEVDCMFPANLNEYDGEKLGVIATPALMTTEMDAVVRASEKKAFLRKENVTVAVNEGNTNYDIFLADNFPGWEIRYYKDTPSSIDAIAAGEADCVILSNYRYNNVARQCEQLHLDTLYTGVDMDYCLALRRGDTKLYSILAKITGIVPKSTIHTALTYYSSEDVKTSFTDLLKENLPFIVLVIAGILVVIMILLLRSIRAERKAMEDERILNDLNRKVFVDPLTSVRNKGAFDEYIEKLEKQIEWEEQTEFAIGYFDCDNLKSVNDQHGHDKGDEYLKTGSQLICRVFKHSPVFRIGGDEFAVILIGEDFKNREELVKQFNNAEVEITASTQNPWEQVHIALGIAVYNPDVDSSVKDTARRADLIMYENKRAGKKTD